MIKRTMALLISLAVGALLLIGGLNYSGFCFDKYRYLSDQEKVQIAILDTLRHYPPTLRIQRLSVVDGIEHSATEFFRPTDAMEYENLEEFLKLNPNCCELTDKGRKGYVGSFWGKVILGNLSDFVRVNYLVRYRKDDGTEVATPFESYVAIANCGNAWGGV